MDITINFEESVRKNLVDFLIVHGALDSHVPECPDVEAKWPEIAQSYIPDGVREFEGYPTVSLGWMMFIGMAMAYYWDKDWTAASEWETPYAEIREKRGFDNLDEAVVEDILGYTGQTAEKVTKLVGDCASRVLSQLRHAPVEAGTEVAFRHYVACLHQLYLAGMAMELNALGYHMTPLNQV